MCANYIGHKYHGNSMITNKVLFLYFRDLSNQQLPVSGLDYLHNTNSNQGNTSLRELTVLTLLLTTIEPTKKKKYQRRYISYKNLTTKIMISTLLKTCMKVKNTLQRQEMSKVNF